MDLVRNMGLTVFLAILDLLERLDCAELERIAELARTALDEGKEVVIVWDWAVRPSKVEFNLLRLSETNDLTILLNLRSNRLVVSNQVTDLILKKEYHLKFDNDEELKLLISQIVETTKMFCKHYRTYNPNDKSGTLNCRRWDSGCNP